MNLIDTNAVTYIFQNNLDLSETCYMAPDVIDEVEMTRSIYNKDLPYQILPIYQYMYFDNLLYIDFYNEMLNSKGGRSFFNMTGFGDISILATIHTSLKIFSLEQKKSLFDPTEPIVVISNDEKLCKRISVEFSNHDVRCVGVESIYQSNNS